MMDELMDQPAWKMKPAKIMTIDFSRGPQIRQHASGKTIHRGDWRDTRPMSGDGKLLTKKQIRARARRRAARLDLRRSDKTIMSELEFERLYKPVEEWDLEELARGRPRNVDGVFSGPKPKWITREVHERAMEQFQLAIKTEMGAQSITALDTLRWVLSNEDTDDRGKPLVPATAKNQAAMFLLEHVVGKPKQHVQQDISVKLQGILGSVMVNPNEVLAPPELGGSGEYQLAHLPGHTLPLGAPEVDNEDEEFDDE